MTVQKYSKLKLGQIILSDPKAIWIQKSKRNTKERFIKPISTLKCYINIKYYKNS